MAIDESSLSAQTQSAAFEEKIRAEIAVSGGEPFKVMTDL
jgi:hypothetical protein